MQLRGYRMGYRTGNRTIRIQQMMRNPNDSDRSVHHRVERFGFHFVPCLVFVCMAIANQHVAGSEVEIPVFSHVTATIQTHFAETRGWQPGDLISRADVKPIFNQLQQLGWTVSDKDKILSEMLGSSDFLVRTLRSRRGARFMQQVSGYKLIYDRLDRISAEPGGQRMIQDLIKLPDGAKYAKQNPGRGIPGMTEFLPKKRSGKSRKLTDYRRPTDKIYTQKQLIQRLQQSYQKDSRPSKS